MMSIGFEITNYFTIKLYNATFHYLLRMSKLLTWFSCRQAILTSRSWKPEMQWLIITFLYKKIWCSQSMLGVPSNPAGTRDEPLRTSAWKGSQCFRLIMIINHYQSTLVNRLISEIDGQSMRKLLLNLWLFFFSVIIITVYLSIVY